MARFAYGGQALIEGVLMRGRDAIAVALRHPDGRILWADERLGVGFRGTRWARLPFMRGLVVLYETLVVGTRWLLRAASVAAATDGVPKPAPAAIGGALTGPADGEGLAAGATAPPAAVAAAPADATPAHATDETGDGRPGAGDPTAEADAPPGSAPIAVVRESDGVDLGKGAVALMLGITLLLGIGLFFFLPLAIARFVAGGQPAIVERAVEGVVQVTIFLGYLIVIGRTPDVRRTFQYHGAEHMTIHALEAGDPLTVEAVRRYPTAHPRCGTEFLVVVILVSIVVFSLVGRLEIQWMVLSRIVLIPVIAGISYELLRFGARHRQSILVRWAFQPGIWVQMVTTKQPTEDMIEVAIVSMEQAMLADGEPLPAGTGLIARAPLSLARAPAPATSPEG